MEQRPIIQIISVLIHQTLTSLPSLTWSSPADWLNSLWSNRASLLAGWAYPSAMTSEMSRSLSRNCFDFLLRFSRRNSRSTSKIRSRLASSLSRLAAASPSSCGTPGYFSTADIVDSSIFSFYSLARYACSLISSSLCFSRSKFTPSYILLRSCISLLAAASAV